MGQKTTNTLPADELSVFCSQLALLLRAGIGSEEAVSILQEDAATGSEREMLGKVHSILLDGSPLSTALASAGVFPDYLVRMIEIGQASGRLDQVLSALASYYRREAATAAAIRRSVLYPSVMAVLVALIFLVLVTRVLPVFQQVFDQLGVALSPVARGLLMAGEAGKIIGGILLLLLAAGAVTLLILSRRSGSASPESKLLAHGKAARAVDRSRFASAMALMLSSGLPLDEAMDRTIHLLEGAPISSQLKNCAERMETGEDFAKAASACGILDGMQAGLLGVGFRAGAADRAMEDLAQRCQEEADDRLNTLLSRLEFALVLLLCGAVGLVLLSVMLPLLGVLSAIG